MENHPRSERTALREPAGLAREEESADRTASRPGSAPARRAHAARARRDEAATTQESMQTMIASASSSELPSSARSSETEMIGKSSDQDAGDAERGAAGAARHHREGGDHDGQPDSVEQQFDHRDCAAAGRSDRLPHSMTSMVRRRFRSTSRRPDTGPCSRPDGDLRSSPCPASPSPSGCAPTRRDR